MILFSLIYCFPRWTLEEASLVWFSLRVAVRWAQLSEQPRIYRRKTLKPTWQCINRAASRRTNGRPVSLADRSIPVFLHFHTTSLPPL